MRNVSVIIPARNEEFLNRTIEAVLSAAQADTEVIAVINGQWPELEPPQSPRLRVLYYPEAIGQRAAVNEGARFSRAKYVLKLDAHCTVDEGFDVKLMEDMQPDWTVVPRMYVLDAFHYVCMNCNAEYGQGPQIIRCEKCGGFTMRRIIFEKKRHKCTDYMYFGPDLRMKYFDTTGMRQWINGMNITHAKLRYQHKRRPWAQGEVTDVMNGIGACFFMERDRFWELGGMDENHGSWGQMAVEVACKAWLSGGRHVVNKKTWFAHLPRTRPGFSFPYDNPPAAQEAARSYSRDLWTNDKWPGQTRPLQWLIDKFSPLPGWDKAA